MNKTDKKAIEEMARQNCHIKYHMKNYKTCKECYETNYCACRVYEVCRNLYNAGYRKQSGWISVEERLPEKSGDYITYHEHGSCGVIYYNASIYLWNVYYFKDTQNAIRSVTHWMPLPEPPKMKGVSHD